MTAGLPGAGLSTLLFVLLAFVMVGREAWLSACGRSSPVRRRAAARQGLIASGIVLTVVLTQLPFVLLAGGTFSALGASPAVLSAAVLAVVLTLAAGHRLVRRWSPVGEAP